MTSLNRWASALTRTGAATRSDRPAARRHIGWIAGAAVTAMLAVILVPGASAPASAAVGWRSVVTSPGLAKGFPEFFDDGNVKVRLCTSDPQCLFQGGLPEYFWYAATAAGGDPVEDPNKNLKVYLAGIEGTYLNFSISNPAPIFPTAISGDEVGFGRLRFRVVHLVTGEWYTITHPYGVNRFQATTAGKPDPTIGEINVTLDNGCVRGDPPVPNGPCNWDEVGAGFLGDYTQGTAAFVRQVNAPDGWLGDASLTALPSAVVGAPSGHNSVIVEGLNAGLGGPDRDRLEVTGFNVQGQILYPGTPSTPDLATASDSGSSSTDNITNATQPTLVGTTDGFAGTEVEVNLLVDGATVPAVSTTTVDGKYSVEMPALAAGRYSVVAEVAGLKRSSPLTFTVDTVAPVVNPWFHPLALTDDTTPTFGITSDDPATFECQLLPSAFAPCTSPKTYAAQIDGDHTFTVRGTDVAGNVSSTESFSWRIDTVAPAVTLQSHPSDITAETTPTFNFTSDDPATFECQLLPSISTFAPCASPMTFPAQIDGVHTLNVRATDFAFRVSVPASFSWVIDTVAPAVTLGSRPSDDSKVTTPTFTFTSDAGATFECQLLSSSSIGNFETCASPKTFATQDDGAHTFNVRATDLAGNVGGTVSLPWRIDTVAPTVNTHIPATNAVDVSQAGDLTATFSEPVVASNATFTLTNVTANVPVPAATSSVNNVVTLNPTAALAAATLYTATLTSGLTDKAGNPIAPMSWSFTTAGAGFTGMAPTRVLNTLNGTGVPRAKLGAGRTLTLTVPGLPAGTTAVAINVMVTNPTAASYLTVYPGGTGRPGASNLNFVAGQTIPNLVLVPLGPGNTITFYNMYGTVNVLGDLVGYYHP